MPKLAAQIVLRVNSKGKKIKELNSTQRQVFQYQACAPSSSTKSPKPSHTLSYVRFAVAQVLKKKRRPSTVILATDAILITVLDFVNAM